MKSPITTHVLDTMKGKPAAGVSAVLELETSPFQWRELARGVTNADGRIGELLPEDHHLATGTYRITFQTGVYYQVAGVAGFYPWVSVVFSVTERKSHYHIPLLLSPFGYSTYRGS
jgi:5-hydroxyisourate hydrolase